MRFGDLHDRVFCRDGVLVIEPRPTRAMRARRRTYVVDAAPFDAGGVHSCDEAWAAVGPHVCGGAFACTTAIGCDGLTRCWKCPFSLTCEPGGLLSVYETGLPCDAAPPPIDGPSSVSIGSVFDTW